MGILIFVYNILSLIIFILLLPKLIINFVIDPSYRKDCLERFGIYKNKKSSKDKLNIWIHCVSVGEVSAAISFVKNIKENHKNTGIIFSTITNTGRQMAEKNIKDYIDFLIYFPFDVFFIVNRAIKNFKPDIVVVFETELWPCFYNTAIKNNAKVFTLNARLSNRSFKRYKLVRFFMKPFLNTLEYILTQNNIYRNRFIELGAQEKKVISIGNLKYDTVIERALKIIPNKMREKIGAEAFFFIAGSTHPGEEEKILKVYNELKKTIFDKNIKLILVPRHPDRVSKIMDLPRLYGLKTQIWSGYEKEKSWDVLIVDVVGVLMHFYSIADIVFVGGSLVPIGGHNIIEPAVFEKVIFYGKYMENFFIEAMLLNKNCGMQVENEDELLRKMRDIILDERLMKKIAHQTKKIVFENRGASDRAYNIIKNYIKTV